MSFMVLGITGGGVLEHIPVDEGGTLCEARVPYSRNNSGQYTLTAVISRLAGGVDFLQRVSVQRTSLTHCTFLWHREDS